MKNESNNEDVLEFETLSELYFGGFHEENRDQVAERIIKKLKEKYTVLGVGRNRIVFLLKSGNYVLKFPLNDAGEGDNDWESSLETNKNDENNDLDFDVITHHTRWIEIEKFCCVIMEYIVPTTEKDNNLPNWCKSVDCGQVGYNKDGILMAFDYGIN